MRPPAYGDQSRAQELWDRYLAKCERQMDFPLSTEDENEVSQVLRPEPLNKINCVRGTPGRKK